MKMTKPENKQAQLSCQELSKQCNDIDSSSSVDDRSPLSHSKRMVHRNLFAASYSSSHHRKLHVSTRSHEHVRKHSSHSEHFRPRSLPLGPEFQDLTGSQMCDENIDDNDYNDDDDDDYDEDEIPAVPDGAAYGLSQKNQDFLDEIESTLHWQVDDEIDVFRSNLHSIIQQQQSQCRHLLASQDGDEALSQTPPHLSPFYAYQEKNMSPGQTVPLASQSEDACTWSSDVMHNLSEQQMIEAMSTSTSSLQGEDGGTQFVSTSGKDGPSQDLLLNRLTIQLLSSALCISNTMQRDECAT